MKKVDLAIIGGGPAGMACAVSAYDSGVRDIVIFERDTRPGGILGQCIHTGFGLHSFGEELCGPEYSLRYEMQLEERGIACKTDTTVLEITRDKIITYVNEKEGVEHIRAKACVLAMGCRERPRGALNIAGGRPAGIYTAGTAQRLINIKGFMPGKSAVILGSGDIGLIMARRMTLEGAQVKAVCEIMPHPGGLARNVAGCLNDFNIPLMLCHTVTKIHGGERVSGVTVARVDDDKKPVPGTQRFISCDTLLLSVGLLPENELSKTAGVALDPSTGGAIVNQDRETNVNGIFACGNVLHVHDLVDFVSEEAAIAGRGAASYILNGEREKKKITVKTQGGIRYALPQTIDFTEDDVRLYFRVISACENARVVLRSGGFTAQKKFRRLSPGEMEEITIKKSDLQKTENEIRITLEG